MRATNKLLAIILVLSLLIVPFAAYADDQPAVADVDIRFFIDNSVSYVNGQPVVMDTAPQIYNGRTLLPIRYVATPLGAQVSWDGTERKVTVALNGITIEMWIDNSMARVNGVAVPIDAFDGNVKPIIINSRTMLPVRFVSEQLQCRVDWDAATRQVQVAQGATVKLMSEMATAFETQQQQNQAQQQAEQQQLQDQQQGEPIGENDKGDDNSTDGSSSALGEGHLFNGRLDGAQLEQATGLNESQLGQLDTASDTTDDQPHIQLGGYQISPIGGGISQFDGSNLQSVDSVVDNRALIEQLEALKDDFGDDTPEEQDWQIAPLNAAVKVTSDESDLPIVMRLGRGYDVFGEYASVESLKYPVLDIDRLVADGVVERIRLDKGINYQTAAKNIKKYSEKMTADTRVSGDYLFFSGSVSTNFDSERTKKLDTYFSTYSYLVQKYGVYINQPEVDLKDYILPTVKDYINDSSNSPSDVFANYGHYILVDSVSGGRIDHSISAEAKASTSYENFKLATKASFDAVVFGTDAALSYQNVKNKSEFDATKDERLTSQGGAMTLNLSQFKNDKQALQNWEATLEDNGTLVAFGKTGARGLVPIWELCDSATRQRELKDAFKILNDQKVLADKWPSEQYIGDIKFVADKTADGARKKCLTGYYLIDMDLNKGAGGYYVYLCYKTTKNPNLAITDLFAELSSDIFSEPKAVTKNLSHNGNVANFTIRKVNLNLMCLSGLSLSKGIFLWTTRDKTREPLKALEVIYSQPNLDHDEWDFVRWQNGSNPANMNETAGGKFITILFKR